MSVSHTGCTLYSGRESVRSVAFQQLDDVQMARGAVEDACIRSRARAGVLVVGVLWVRRRYTQHTLCVRIRIPAACSALCFCVFVFVCMFVYVLLACCAREMHIP